MGLVQAQGGVGGVVMGLGGKDGRAGINVWGFRKVRQAQQYTEECLGADAEVLLDQGASSPATDSTSSAFDH